MSFKFNFDLEEPDSDDTPNQLICDEPHQQVDVPSVWDEKSYSVSLDELLATLPSRILYSPLPLPFALPQPLLRRDLHDARFQLASTSSLGAEFNEATNDTSGGAGAEGGKSKEAGKVDRKGKEKEQDQGEAYVSAGTGTDLIPGLYEGGLKTWEGGVDLVQVLSGVREGEGGVGEWVRGRGVIEIGCGTVLPSSYILSRLLATPPLNPSSTDATKTPPSPIPLTKLLLQDYNLPVLTLVSLPNLLLAALPYLPMTLLEPITSGPDPTSPPSTDPTDTAETHLAEITDTAPDFSDAGELEITQELKDAFKRLLKERGVELEFRYGGWKGLAGEIREERIVAGGEGKGYGLVLSAETIYAEGSVEDLIGVLKAASGAEGRIPEKKEGNGDGGKKALDDGLGISGLSVKDGEEWDKVDLKKGGSVVLIAAKVLYFGVGGGLQDFLDRVESEKGWWTPVKEWTKGVGRKVVRVGW